MNRVDLSNLPRTSKGIDWLNCNEIKVNFNYKNIEDELVILKHLDVDHVLIGYKNKEYVFPKTSFVKGCLGKLFDFAIANNYKYNIGDTISRPLSNIVVIDHIRINKRNVKGYLMKCDRCNSDFKISESNLSRNQGCPVCSGHKVMVGVNDLWTTHPEIASNLLNDSDGYKYSFGSNKRVDFKCSKCGHLIKKKIIGEICSRGFSCPSCGDGISYPNKFMYNLLFALNEDFDNEVKFDWCIFPKFNDINKMTYGYYDFVIEKDKTIIEMDSGLGHGNKCWGNTSNKEEYLYRDNQKDLLAKKHGYKIIRINCAYYGNDNRFEICKNAILDSELNAKYDLSNIDWNDINYRSTQSFVFNAIELFNSGYNTLQISKIMKKAQCTIIDYLHLGDKLSLCKFKI